MAEGHVWQGSCIAGGGCALEGRGHVWQGEGVRVIRSMSWRYTSYWNAFLFIR